MPTREEIEAQARAGDAFRQGWWTNIAGLSQATKDFLSRFVPNPPPVTAPEPGPEAALPQIAPEAPAAPAAPAGPVTPPTTLEEFRTQLQEARAALAAAEAVAKDESQPPDIRTRAAATAVTLRGGVTAILTQIAAEENRARDEAAAAKKAEEDKAEKKRLEDKADTKVADSAPKNGDDRWVPIETKDDQGRTVRGVGREVYTNGVWKYQPGSAKADTGFGSGPQGPGTPPSIVTDGRGTYWTVDLQTGKATAISGPQAAAKTITDPSGNVFLQNPDGTPGQKLFDAAPKTVTENGRIIGLDPRTYQKIFEVDTKTPEGRALADRLERATVEAAERSADPKFASAVAQYRQEAQRRQGLARTELARLQDLQKSGQLSPEMAEAEFDRWMKNNVEGPLAGFRAAAEQERAALEQANLNRTQAEATRVETANRERGRLAYEADASGRAISREIAERTRAPEFIQDLGGLANSLASGRTDFKFSPGSFDVANYRKAMPNMDELADKAVQRLFSFVPEARARDVNVPLPAMPAGDDLRGLMDQVRYTPPGAIAAAPAPPALAPPPPPAPPALPGQQPGESEEERRARWSAIMSR